MKKLDLQDRGIKTKLILHVEKLVFGLAIALVAAFIYFGTQRETIQTKPDELVKAATNAEDNMKVSTWEKVEAERWVAPEYQAAAARASKPIPLNPYETPSSFKVRDKESVEKRPDPDLLTVTDIQLRAGFAPLAMLSTQRLGVGGYGGEEMARGGSYEGGYPMSGGYPGGGYDMYGGEMGGETNPDAPPVLTPEQQQALGPAKASAGSKIEGKYFVSVTALVPLKKQLDLYNSAFKDRANYIEARDYPRYVYFAVERREQAADGSWGEWEHPINVAKERINVQTRWAFRPDEVIPPEYMDPVLTFPIPPILLFDPSEWARHSEIPKYEPRDLYNGQETEMMAEEIDPLMGREISDAPGEVPFATGGMMEGGGMGGYPSPYGGPGGYPGQQGQMINGRMVMTPPPGMIQKPTGAGGGPGSGSYGGEGGGYPGGGSSYGNGMFDAENKMFRFFDTSVQPNKNYQYRIQLWLEDPNMPEQVQQIPPVRALEPGVIARVQAERDKISKAMNMNRGGGYEGNMGVANQRPVHTYWRKTEFSEASPSIRVPSSADVLAGGIEAGRTVYNHNDHSKVLRNADPSAKILAMKWDPKEDVKAVVTKEIKNVSRGSAVEYKGDLWVLDPMTYTFKKPWPIDTEEKNPEYVLKTGYTVLDIRGGQDTFGRFADEKNEKLKVPGEILVMDDAGNIHIKTELDEVKKFAKFNFEKPEVKRKSSSEMDESDLGSYEEYGSGRGGRRGRSGP
ncbi:hypothetical protein [Blastopirellula marina]|uniref:Uncharacterized protein n=1 Tax=Blastopirellula marina TaxID=124 RepID=A0A2S8G2C2_9BACT|nr:hypothetical protein [Blastopirellula marina]PQO38595.1 hypothetical protein C5Y98_11145 [Blastopirellula marina]PTL45252.1 hypothetical protein C5Y97_11155 [Blastopirellula marina]